MTLYELNARILELLSTLDSMDAPMSEREAMIAEIEAELTALYVQIDAKREAYVHVYKNAQAHAQALKAESRRLAGRARVMESLSSRMKSALQADLEANGEVEAQAGLFRLAIRKSPASVEVSVSPESLPAEFRRTVHEADKASLKSALQAGREVDGVELVERSHLRIK